MDNTTETKTRPQKESDEIRRELLEIEHAHKDRVNKAFVRRPIKKYPGARVLPKGYYTAAELRKKRIPVPKKPDGELYYILSCGGGSGFSDVYQTGETK